VQTLRGSVNGNVLVPLPSERTPLTTDPAVYRLIQRWIDAYPKTLPNRTDTDPRALNTNSPQSIDTGASNIRLDQDLGARDKIFAQHAFTNQKVMAFEFVAGQNPDTNNKSHNARLTWNHLFDAHSFIDFTIGFDRVHSLLVPEPNAVGPQVFIGTAYQTLGPGSTVQIVFAMQCSIVVRLAITCSRLAAKSTACRTMAWRQRASGATTTFAPTSAEMPLRTSEWVSPVAIQSQSETDIAASVGLSSSISLAMCGRFRPALRSTTVCAIRR
jgi:hypothetical protein